MKPMIIFLCMFPIFAHASVCEDLQTVTDQASSGFSDWKGSYDSELNEYAATQSLPGATGCFIEGDDDFPVYSCRWEMSDESKMISNYHSLVNEISSCSNVFSQRPRVRAVSGQSGSSRYYQYRNEETTLIEGNGTDFRIKVRSKSRMNRRDHQEVHLVSVAVEQR